VELGEPAAAATGGWLQWKKGEDSMDAEVVALHFRSAF
jgi:hypothetical protein